MTCLSLYLDMRLLKLLPIAVLAVLAISWYNNHDEDDVIGSYVSKEPSNLEIISIMNIRGHFHSVHTALNFYGLEVNKNHTFTFYDTYCNKGKIDYAGKWSLKESKLVLDFNGEMEDMELTVRKNQLYSISDFTVSRSGEKMKSLLLLEKQ